MKQENLTTLHLMAFVYLTLAEIDNDATDNEMSLAITKLHAWGEDDPEATNRIINESFVWYMDSRDQNKIGQEIENNLHLFNGFNEDHRKAILNDMIQIIKADGNIDPQETKFFKAIADCLGVDLG